MALTIIMDCSTQGCITLYTENSPLDPRHCLSRSGASIRDLTTGQQISTVNIRNVNRGPNPRRRVQGCREEPYFLTLQAGVLTEIPIYFGRPGFRPQPWSVVKLGWEVDEFGRPRRIRRSMAVTGVDGLEPGHEYEVRLSEDDLRHIMWAPVPKEDILLKGGYHELEGNLERHPWIKDQPVDFVVRSVKLEILAEDEM